MCVWCASISSLAHRGCRGGSFMGHGVCLYLNVMLYQMVYQISEIMDEWVDFSWIKADKSGQKYNPFGSANNQIRGLQIRGLGQMETKARSIPDGCVPGTMSRGIQRGIADHGTGPPFLSAELGRFGGWWCGHANAPHHGVGGRLTGLSGKTGRAEMQLGCRGWERAD